MPTWGDVSWAARLASESGESHMTGCMMPEWFRRFGDIPGTGYATPEQIDRRSLAGCDDVPEVHNFQFDSREETLIWPLGDGGSSSASPAHFRAFSGFPDARTAEHPATALIQNVHEGLELPGEPADYHFLIQNTVDALWRRRRNEPELLGEVERLCWLDIGLIKVRPDTASDIIGGQRHFSSITGFWLLIKLYEDRGHLAEALNVAENCR